MPQPLDLVVQLLHPRDAGYEVRLARSAHRVRVLRRDDLIARIHD